MKMSTLTIWQKFLLSNKEPFSPPPYEMRRREGIPEPKAWNNCGHHFTSGSARLF
uniref:Uncharacterized protein n=1 Tax=Anguilla anguilla TaxID=7936 RepID=A0A0E9Q9I5_ANGAN